MMDKRCFYLLAFLLVIPSLVLGQNTSDRITVLEDYHGYFPCSDCHDDQETDSTPRVLIDEHYEPLEWEDDDGNTFFVEFGELVSFADLLAEGDPSDIRSQNLARVGQRLNIEEYMEDEGYALEDSVWTLMHGGANLWCMDCHDTDDRDYLRKLNGELLDYNQSHLLCGQCHGPVLLDWDQGLHGKVTGYWQFESDNEDESIRLLCVECHTSHAPRFRPEQPLAGPVSRISGPQPKPVHHDSHRGNHDELGPHAWETSGDEEGDEH